MSAPLPRSQPVSSDVPFNLFFIALVASPVIAALLDQSAWWLLGYIVVVFMPIRLRHTGARD